MMGDTVLAWHFLAVDKRLRWGSREVVEVGKTYTATGPLVMCHNGMHGSVRAIDALGYAPGPIACRVELGGELVKDTDKLVARTRHVLSMVDATELLHEFACCCAEAALLIGGVTDDSCWQAIEAKWAWMRGDISDDELAAAGAAAWDAARAAAGAAAWDAARAAAWGAARAAAWAAAWDAAWDAARAAARDAARDAARFEQNTLLEQMLTEKR